MSKIKSWEEVTQKLNAKLLNWKLKALSVGGRLTLLKLVLGSVPIYNMSLFKVLIGVLNKFESLRSRFFRGVAADDKKMAWVSWDKVCSDKEFGGLGVGTFFALNRALLFKWSWRFRSNPEALWVSVVKAIHGRHAAMDGAWNYSGSIWRDI